MDDRTTMGGEMATTNGGRLPLSGAHRLPHVLARVALATAGAVDQET
jgi:hypothetical protein